MNVKRSRGIDQARNDALDAAARAGRLQQQLVAIREQLRQYNATVGAGSSAADTGIFADVFEKSLERNRQLAEYADRAAGRKGLRKAVRSTDETEGTVSR